jgi:hypothetical protein
MGPPVAQGSTHRTQGEVERLLKVVGATGCCACWKRGALSAQGPEDAQQA